MGHQRGKIAQAGDGPAKLERLDEGECSRLIGTVLRSRSVEEKVVLLHEWARHVLPLLSAGRLRPVVDEMFSLDEAARAHDRLERNASFGKLVLRVASD